MKAADIEPTDSPQPEVAVPRAAGLAPLIREPGQTVDAAYRRAGELRYDAEDRAIVGRNGPHFNNRPLYCQQNTEGAVLVGDRPFVRLIAKPYLHGALALAFERGGRAKYLHDFGAVESRYRCGSMTWIAADADFPGVQLTLTVVPLVAVAGFALRLRAEGVDSGDRLIWSYGGAQREEDPRWKWDPVMRGNPDICRSGDPRRPLLAEGMVPAYSSGNRVELHHDRFRLAAAAGATHVATGQLCRHGLLRIGDAGAGGDVHGLLLSEPGSLPVVVGAVALLAGTDELHLAVEVAPAGATEAGRTANPPRAFADGVAYLEDVERARSSTPDPRFDAALAAVCHAVDGNCEHDPYIFRHGCMAFSCRFVGWRVICGATALGWHERVLGNARYTIGLQKSDDSARTKASPDEERLRCHEGKDSRFFGRGSLDRGFPMYDVQSQFFDQTINDWRATADPEMERLLRPALELHLEWLRECFDPDDDGLYESYINTLPTDSVWYNGGGSVEASAYAYTGHHAAMDLARRANDPAAERRHREQAEKIRRGLHALLWLPERGHFGLYREQGGLERVHADAWTYSVFLPIDAGLTTRDEAWQALHYTEWALERIPLPFGGELCQLSNWVPWKWSVRDMFGGDLCHLALAYFQSGLADEGYALLRGVMHEGAFASVVPGGFSHIGAATDFGDNAHMFARVSVEGLFGYVPDYPNGRVLIRPAFPSAWTTAFLETSDFSLRYEQAENSDRYSLSLSRPADAEFRLPVRAAGIRAVTCGGQPVAFRTEAGWGCSLVILTVPDATTAEIVVQLTARAAQIAPVKVTGGCGDWVELDAPSEGPVTWRDPQGGLLDVREANGKVSGRLARAGHQLVAVTCRRGGLPFDRIFKLQVTDPSAEQRAAEASPRASRPGSRFEPLDLRAVLNADVRDIFKQQYLSPRPSTCSVRLGIDGYSAWTFPYWALPAPEVALDRVPLLRDAAGRIVAPPGIPFAGVDPDGRNIAFTSRWDNWPTAVTLPVGIAADTAWVLLCGTTFPMQTRIANAVLQFEYTDGGVETLELIPPENFWMLSTWGGCDYSYEHDAFCLPPVPPLQIQLGANCRAIVLARRLRPGVTLRQVTLETLSQDVVIGLMGLTLEHHRR